MFKKADSNHYSSRHFAFFSFSGSKEPPIVLRRLFTKNTGFTLAELLICLAVLGIIASFTVPKIMNTSSESQKTAAFKESISTLSNVIFTGHSNQSLKTNMSDSEFMNYLAQNINTLKYCQSDSNGEGCSGGQDFWGWSPGNRKGILLQNGVFIMLFGIYSVCSSGDTVVLFIDLNNGKAPNLKNEDQLEISANLGNSVCQSKPGQIIPHGDNAQFYNNFFK